MSTENYQEQRFRLYMTKKRLEKAQARIGESLKALSAIHPLPPPPPQAEEMDGPDCQALRDYADACANMLDSMFAADDALHVSIDDMTEVANMAENDWFVNCGV